MAEITAQLVNELRNKTGLSGLTSTGTATLGPAGAADRTTSFTVTPAANASAGNARNMALASVAALTLERRNSGRLSMRRAPSQRLGQPWRP